jgi:tRNA modification GTPase
MPVPVDIQETIVALSSPPGPGARAIIRVTGASALSIVRRIFALSAGSEGMLEHGWHSGQIALPGIHSPLPADLFVSKAPRTYTGQDLAELHTFSVPPLVDLVIGTILDSGARAARPGELTMRAFLAGKLDLTRAEAVAAVIEAASRDELKQALVQLAGGMSRPLQKLRGDLLDLLADVEASLDFAEEDIAPETQEALLHRLAGGMAQVTLVLKQLEQRSLAGLAFRVALVGRPNAGKSSLFNALMGTAAALVSPEPGTTRDYLVGRLSLEGVAVELVDTAGLYTRANGIEQRAQVLGREQAERASLLLLCVETGRDLLSQETALLSQSSPPVLGVETKCDLSAARRGWPATSAVTGMGLGNLRSLLAGRARTESRPALAPSLSRCRHHVVAGLEHLRQAHQIALNDEPPELLAAELRGALDELGEMVGAIYTDDLLDRIFSRFCIGK